MDIKFLKWPGIFILPILFIVLAWKTLERPANGRPGYLSLKITANGELVMGDRIVVLDHYQFEPNEIIKCISAKPNYPESKIVTDQTKDLTLTDTIGYLVSHLEDSTFASLHMNEHSPKLLSSMLANEKNRELVVKSQVKDLVPDVPFIVFKKDTVIANVKYKLYVNQCKNGVNGHPVKVTFYSNQEISLPVHPISQALDTKFGGTITEMAVETDDGLLTCNADIKENRAGDNRDNFLKYLHLIQ